MRFSPVIASVILAISLSACATSGPLYKEVKAGSAAEPPAKSARVYIYRNVNFFGDGIQPSVLLDNQKIGDARPGGFMMKDIAPGKHVLSVSVETTKTYEFTAKTKEEIYIRLVPGLGWIAARIQIEPVTAQEALPEISELHQQTSFAPYEPDATYPGNK